MSDEIPLARCMGGRFCIHTPGTCTATNVEYQAKAKEMAAAKAVPMQTDDLAAQMVREMEETPKEIAEAELIVTALRAWAPLVSSGYECPAAGQTMHVAAEWIEKAIRAERAGKDGRCKCTFAQKMTGDGCDVCNPERAKDYAHDH